MSKTPRTDAKEWTVLSSYEPTVNVVLSSFARQLESENAELREALELFAHIDQTRDGYRPNEMVREDFLRACPEFIGYAKSARALLAKVEGK